MSIYITSDLHGFHKNICYVESAWEDKESNCHKYNTVSEMNRAIIKSINSIIDVNDTLIHLGDFAFGGYLNVVNLRSSIFCSNVININGNHDKEIRKNHVIPFMRNGYNENNVNVQDLFAGVYESPYYFYYGGYTFIMSHYPPQGTTNFKDPNTIYLHGHCHHKLDNNEMHKAHNVIDVGWDGKVYSIEYFIKRSIKTTHWNVGG